MVTHAAFVIWPSKTLGALFSRQTLWDSMHCPWSRKRDLAPALRNSCRIQEKLQQCIPRLLEELCTTATEYAHDTPIR